LSQSRTNENGGQQQDFGEIFANLLFAFRHAIEQLLPPIFFLFCEFCCTKAKVTCDF
jgi:hypothetical protein